MTPFTHYDGNVRYCEYDVLNKPNKRIDVMRNEMVYVYDATGQKVKEIDSLGLETSYSYNELSQVTEVKRENTLLIHCEYDSRGLLSQFQIRRPLL